MANKEAVAACNQRLSNMQRRCARMLVKSPAMDLYYAAVAVLVETGMVAKWVRRRDLRKGFCGKDAGV